MTHGRKYGEKESRPIPVWNGIFEHYDRIGDALWEFEKCIDWITDERDGVGIVLGGKPVKVSEIVAAIKGSNRETVRRHLDTLEKEKFIRRRRTPYGHVIEVLNSRKFGIWKPSKEKPQNVVSLGVEKHGFVQEKPKSVQEKHGFVVYKEDAAGTQQKDAAAARSAAWKFLGVDGSRFSPSVRELCEGLYLAKNGQTPAEFVGVCMDGIVGLGERIPAQLAQRAAGLRSESKARKQGQAQELEAIPWARK